VIEGGALQYALQDNQQQYFLALCRACTGVVCCRVSPIQKVGPADVARHVVGCRYNQEMRVKSKSDEKKTEPGFRRTQETRIQSALDDVACNVH